MKVIVAFPIPVSDSTILRIPRYQLAMVPVLCSKSDHITQYRTKITVLSQVFHIKPYVMALFKKFTRSLNTIAKKVYRDAVLFEGEWCMK